MSEEKNLERHFNEKKWPTELEGVNNYAILSGKLKGDFEYSHRFRGENYYKTRISLKRKSDAFDVITIVVREALIGDLGQNSRGKFVEVTGQISTFDVVEEIGTNREKHHLGICFSVESIIEIQEPREENNIVFIRGQLCKPPYIKVKSSGLLVAEVLVAVKRTESTRKDYIPCVCWRSKASYAEEELHVGSDIAVRGRLQSRTYFKRDRNNPELGKYKTTYEVAIAKFF